MAPIRAAYLGNAGITAPASCGPQIMLYVSLPMGSQGSSSLPRYGLRVGEFRRRPTTTQLVAMPPTQRELVDLQMVAHADVRIEFGRRLIWNITRQTVGPQSSRAALTIGVPIRGVRLSDTVNQQPWDPGNSGMSALTDNPIPRRRVEGQSLAILKMIIPSHGTPTHRPTIQFWNTQTTEAEAVLVPHGAETR